MVASLAQALLVLLSLIGLTLWLKARGIFRSEDGPTLSRVVTDLLLPAVIFSSLAQHALTPAQLLPAAIMVGATLGALWLAWLTGRVLGLQDRRLGAFALVAGIGSSASLGYTLIGQVYADNPQAVVDAVVIGELGVGLPLFVVGVPVALHFGGVSGGGEARWRALWGLFRSPIFVALAAGMAVAFVGLPEDYWVKVLLRVLDTLGGALVVLVAFSVGLMLKTVRIASVWAPMAAVIGLKLLLEPVLASEVAGFFGLAVLERNVLLIESAMPSGAVAAVIAARYGCDGEFASAMVIVTFFAGLASLPLLLYMLG